MLVDTMDWKAKKSWLEAQFGAVTTKWRGPDDFMAHVSKVEISDGHILRSVSGEGKTGEECISDLFANIVQHGSGKHVYHREVGGARRFTVDPQTLVCTPFVL